MIYLDANIFIYPILSQDLEKSMICKKILIKVADGKLAAITSSLTWDEVVWTTRRYLGIADSIEESKKFIEFPNLRFMEINESVLAVANRFLEQHKLKPRDSIHAATAVINMAEEIISDDHDFDSIKGIRRTPIEKFNA
ncbi:MAG TPA: type II toxin-antitoxin system VapC family toxin [archaeon]|nr:type II toxin-antitoxin system VapC family toxin [archaeon]